jgi:hypothetical protein
MFELCLLNLISGVMLSSGSQLADIGDRAFLIAELSDIGDFSGLEGTGCKFSLLQGAVSPEK